MVYVAVAGRRAQPARSDDRAVACRIRPTAAEHDRRRQTAGRRRRQAAAPQGGGRGGGFGGRRASAAGTGIRRSSSARTTAAGSTSAASGCIAATIAATRGSTVSPDLTRQLDADEDRDHGQGLAGRLGRLQPGDDDAEHDHRDRRIAAARRAALCRHRRRAGADHARTAARPGARSRSSRASPNTPTSPTSSPRRATPTRSSRR